MKTQDAPANSPAVSHDKPLGTDAGSLKRSILSHLRYTLAKDEYTATKRDYYLALVYALRDRLTDHWSLDGLTTLVYSIAKIQLGLPLDVKPTPELKVAQRTFFALLYHLLVGRDTGPRLPTLLLVIGAEKVRRLLGG